MKYKVRLTGTRSYASYTHNFREEYYFHYSDRMQVKSLNKSVELYAPIKDAETLQRLNPQHEVEIYSVNDKCYFPLWFFRKFEIFITADPTKEWGKAYFYYLMERGQPYEPTHPIVDQAPAFIYKPSDKFLNKKRSLSVERMFGFKMAEHSQLTMTELKEYLTNIFVRRSNKERKSIKVGIYCPHVGQYITVGPDSWGCSECYHERIGKHLHEHAQNYLKVDKYYGKHT